MCAITLCIQTPEENYQTEWSIQVANFISEVTPTSIQNNCTTQRYPAVTFLEDVYNIMMLNKKLNAVIVTRFEHFEIITVLCGSVLLYPCRKQFCVLPDHSLSLPFPDM